MKTTKKLGKEMGKLRAHESVPFGILLAVVGGYLDAYTYIGRDGVFANAQTGNIVLLGIYASQRAWEKALTYLPPILAFVLGVFAVEMIKRFAPRLFQTEWTQVVLVLEVVILSLLGFIPARFPDIAVNVIISFVASVQVCSFSKLVDDSYATTMMTGNLRALSQSAYKALVERDRKAAIRTVRYMTIIVFFLLGAVIGGLLTISFPAKAIWGCAAILLCCAIWISLECRNINK